MSHRNWIEFPRIEGETSRQAHADLPAGTYRTGDWASEGFFGPATHMYHKSSTPTGWTAVGRAAQKPRAFDLP